ncbi:MAG: intradiol ring-cleavage dioxygenase [Nitrospira sp. BO4]|jgi:protocatechuate 3,4-dioxygenase beta subunit|nr:intradiol ring-cleavage dioxygenase [Nitrospira sp. BO4]
MNENDDHIGRLLSRREALVVMGAAGAGFLMGSRPQKSQADSGTPRSLCIVRPEQTEGPYFVDERLHRSDIRTDPVSGQVKPGTPLALTFRVMRLKAGACQPLPDAQVDIWHCDAQGIYSDVRDPSFNTLGQKFLRGHQMTDAQGEARFLTIYPGWYSIRTVHVHFKIRTAPATQKAFEFTSQVYFPDEFTDRAYASLPYSSNGPRKVRNRHDFIFRQGGEQLILEPSATDSGYSSTFAIALKLP